VIASKLWDRFLWNSIRQTNTKLCRCHISVVWTLASYRGDPGPALGDINLDSGWTKWHWGSFSQNSSVFLLLIIIQPLLYTHLSPPHEVCDSPDTLSYSLSEVRGFISGLALGWSRSRSSLVLEGRNFRNSFISSRLFPKIL
jgi:hypothetical protein